MTGTAVAKITPKVANAYLVHYSNARKELAACVRVDEVKKIRDKSIAIKVYAALSKDRQLEELAIEVRERAERRAGEMLIEMAKRGERAAQGNANKGMKASGGQKLPVGRGRGGNTPADRRVGHTFTGERSLPTLADMGISQIESHQWQKKAKTPEPEFEDQIAAKKKGRRKEKTLATGRKRAESNGAAERLALDLYRFMKEFMPKARTMIRTCDLTPKHRDSFLTTIRQYQSDFVELIAELNQMEFSK